MTKRTLGRTLGFALGGAAALALCLSTRAASASGPYVTIRDNGAFAKKATTEDDLDAMQTLVLAQLRTSGVPIPDLLSVWTSFPAGGSGVATYFIPDANDVTGIGLEPNLPGTGIFPSKTPPLRAMLMHNDITSMSARAAHAGAPVAGYAEYLFLLELSHVWGPTIKVPAVDGGSPEDALVGFPFHWSFWVDAGGSPAGGNRWTDNHDGTFTAQRGDPQSLTYSMLDLYLMGLADPNEVPPFGVLENATPPAGVTDPLWGGAYAAHSFPWFSSGEMRVTATRRALTIDDVVAKNGARSPARATSPSTFTLGVVLVVGAAASDADLANAQALMDPVAARLAPRFHEATQGRGTLTLVTASPASDADAGAPDTGDLPAPPSPAPTDAGGCNAQGHAGGSALAPFAFAALLVAFLRARTRRDTPTRD